jgi:hypothetical protein
MTWISRALLMTCRVLARVMLCLVALLAHRSLTL